jgi:archaellum biogenesis protein FlaJ (TadC family)
MGRIKELKQNKKLFYTAIALPVPFILALFAFLIGGSSTTVIAVISIGLIIVVVPSIWISFKEYAEIKSAEDQFPHFLEDLSQSTSAGMTLPQAINVASKTQYGKLTKHIKQLNIWLSWNQSFPTAWEKFTKRLSKSQLIRRVNAIILEAFHGGGDVKKTLGSLAEDVNIIKDMESERKSIMQQQIVIMYIIFFVFVGVIIALYKILSPILYVQQIGSFSGIGIQEGGTKLTLEYFRNLFFLMTLVEAICAGLIAGVIAEERVVAGIKHVLVMVSATIFVFFVFVFPADLSVEISIFPSEVPIEGKVTITGKAFSEGAPVAGATISVTDNMGLPKQLFTDNSGEFRYFWVAPEEPGEYTVHISIEREKEIKNFVRTIRVIS